VWCLWSYLLDTAIKRWKTSFIKFTELLRKSVWFFILVFVILSIVIIIVVIKFPKSSKIVTTLFSALIIIISTYVLFVFYIVLVLFFIVPIFGLRGLVRALPALVNELEGRVPKDVVEDSRKYLEDYPCMKHFGGNAAEALSRISRSTFFSMLIVSLPIEITIIILRTLRIVPLTIESAVTKAVIDVALGVLGVILSIVIGLLLFSSQAKFDANTLRFVYDVKFTVLEWFVVAMFLIIISVMVPSYIAVLIMVPTIIAIIISVNVYVILASAIIDYMQLPRNNQGEN